MKSRIMLTVLVIALAAALIAGATSAWFTAETDVPTAEFTAGTVEISADGEVGYAVAEGKSFQNVNPGDCGKVTWKIYNIGTKAVELRVKLSELWQDYLSTENFFYAPEKDSDWVMYSEENEEGEEEIWLYYTNGPIRGTFDYDTEDPEGLDPAMVELTLVVAFDGPNTGNEYQGKWFELSGLIEAVQASNDAPKAVWGDFWEGLKNENYEPAPESLAGQYLAYMKNVKCYNGGDPGPGDPEKYNVSAIIVDDDEHGWVDGVGEYDADEEVELTANAKEGYRFVRWELPGGLELTYGDTESETIKFNMPAKDIQVTAVFEEEEVIPDTYKLTVKANPKQGGTVSGGGKYEEGAKIQLTATPNSKYRFLNWTRGEEVVSNDANFTYDMPGEDVILVANFYKPEVTRIEISGPDEIDIPKHGSVKKTYTATVYDQNDNVMSGTTVQWSEDRWGDSVTINQNGVLTVKNNAREGNVTITASIGSVSATKRVYLDD